MKLLSDSDLRRISFVDLLVNIDDGYDFADAFKMGSCDIFAIALNKTFGYEICRVDYKISFHMFCRAQIKGETIYIDASGMSNNLSDLQLQRTNELIKPVASCDCILETPLDYIGMGFALKVIDEYREYYDVNCFFGGFENE